MLFNAEIKFSGDLNWTMANLHRIPIFLILQQKQPLFRPKVPRVKRFRLITHIVNKSTVVEGCILCLRKLRIKKSASVCVCVSLWRHNKIVGEGNHKSASELPASLLLTRLTLFLSICIHYRYRFIWCPGEIRFSLWVLCLNFEIMFPIALSLSISSWIQ